MILGFSARIDKLLPGAPHFSPPLREVGSRRESRPRLRRRPKMQTAPEIPRPSREPVAGTPSRYQIDYLSTLTANQVTLRGAAPHRRTLHLSLRDNASSIESPSRSVAHSGRQQVPHRVCDSVRNDMSMGRVCDSVRNDMSLGRVCDSVRDEIRLCRGKATELWGHGIRSRMWQIADYMTIRYY